jgi:hypothetical protein
VLTNENLLQAFSAAGAEDGIVYLSTSITSGLRLFKVSQSLGILPEDLKLSQPDAWKELVVDANFHEAQRLAKALRGKYLGKLVIDPSMIEVKGWQQFDYNSFWVSLISNFPTTLVVAPNWEYSRGARYEVAHAFANRTAVLDTEGSSITAMIAETLTSDASTALKRMGFDEERLSYYLPPLVDPPIQTMSAASQCFEWLVRERDYQVNKFGVGLDDQHTLQGLGEDSWWWQQLMNYFHRSKVLGLDTPVGRQAFAKFAATSCGLLESIIRVYGSLPNPGVSSGEIEW